MLETAFSSHASWKIPQIWQQPSLRKIILYHVSIYYRMPCAMTVELVRKVLNEFHIASMGKLLAKKSCFTISGGSPPFPACQKVFQTFCPKCSRASFSTTFWVLFHNLLSIYRMWCLISSNKTSSLGLSCTGPFLTVFAVLPTSTWLMHNCWLLRYGVCATWRTRRKWQESDQPSNRALKHCNTCLALEQPVVHNVLTDHRQNFSRIRQSW